MQDNKRTTDRLNAALSCIVTPGTQGRTIFTETMPEEARLASAASDRRLAAGSLLSPLDGRIVSVKALFDIAGKVTSAGSAVLRDQPTASSDAMAVDRLKRAGAVVIGRTTMTEFAFSAVGVNPHEGSLGNPHDRSRIPGGSSSGAAVSIHEGMAEIALGSDTGGSIRIPAALCGLVGFKPTAGVVPTGGAFSLSQTLDVVGPIARNVADCAEADAVLRGSVSRALPRVDLATVAMTMVRGRLSDEMDDTVKEAIENAFDRLLKVGALIKDGSLEPELDALASLDRIGVFTAPELMATLMELGVSNLSGVDPRTRSRIEEGRVLSATDYVRMHRQRAAMITMLDVRLASGEVLMLPTVPVTAVPMADVVDSKRFNHINRLLLRNPRVANLFDIPAISLPLQVSGLPVGLMLMTRRGDDRRLLAIAAAVEHVLSG